MNIMAIDCGASYIKGALIDYSTKQIKKKYYKTTLRNSGNLKLLRLSETINTIIEIITTVSDEGDTLHMAIANEMHGFVLADISGQGYFDFISWQNEFVPDGYSPAGYIKYIRNILTEKDILETGMPIKLGLPSTNLFYILNNDLKDISSGIYFYTLGDYIIRSISDQQPYMHPTNAAATGLYNILNDEWNRSIIRKLKLDRICFPAISSDRPIECNFYGRNLIIYPAIGDQQAALFGAGLMLDSELSVNMGTGAQVSVLCKAFELSPGYQIRPYFDGWYLKTIPHIPSGRALNVYYRFIKDIILSFNNEITDKSIWDYIITQARDSSFGSLGIDLSFFSNPITINTMGSIDKIKENEFFVGNLFRSIFKQMSENIYIIANRLVDLKNINRIILSGGVIEKNKLLQDFILEYFNNIHDYQVETDETFKGLINYMNNLI
jgi:sugar (pentulose or hexulose) kinase